MAARKGGRYEVRKDGSIELVERTNWKPEKPTASEKKASKKSTETKTED